MERIMGGNTALFLLVFIFRTLFWAYATVEAGRNVTGNCSTSFNCHNNGACSQFEHSGYWTHNCQCSDGYSGDDCEIVEIIDLCDPNPCSSGEFCGSNQTTSWCRNCTDEWTQRPCIDDKGTTAATSCAKPTTTLSTTTISTSIPTNVTTTADTTRSTASTISTISSPGSIPTAIGEPTMPNSGKINTTRMKITTNDTTSTRPGQTTSAAPTTVPPATIHTTASSTPSTTTTISTGGTSFTTIEKTVPSEASTDSQVLTTIPSTRIDTTSTPATKPTPATTPATTATFPTNNPKVLSPTSSTISTNSRSITSNPVASIIPLASTQTTIITRTPTPATTTTTAATPALTSTNNLLATSISVSSAMASTNTNPSKTTSEVKTLAHTPSSTTDNEILTSTHVSADGTSPEKTTSTPASHCSALQLDIANAKQITNITISSASALNWTTGVQVIHSCFDGYQLAEGSKIATYTCKEDGLWENFKQNVCKEIPTTTPPVPTVCAPPVPVVNFTHADQTEATKMMSDMKIFGVVLHKCDDGYELPDGSTMAYYLCNSDGLWQNVQYHICDKVKCPPLNADYDYTTANTRRSIKEAAAKRYVWGTTILHECLSGFALPDGSRATTYRCGPDKRWSNYNGAMCIEVPMTGTNVDTSSTAIPTLVCPSHYQLLANYCISSAHVSNAYDAAALTCATTIGDGDAVGNLPMFPNEQSWLDFKREISKRKYITVWIWAKYDFRRADGDKYLWGDHSQITWNVPWLDAVEPTPPSFHQRYCVYADRKVDYHWSIQECRLIAHYVCVTGSELRTTAPTTTTSTTVTTTTSTAEFTFYDEDYDYEKPAKAPSRPIRDIRGCRPPVLSLNNIGEVTKEEVVKLKARYLTVNTTFVHQCASDAAFQSGITVRIYTCLPSGRWLNYKHNDARCWMKGETTTTTTKAPTTTVTTTEDPSEALKRKLAQINLAAMDRFRPSEMSEGERAVATAAQSMGCLFLVVSLSSVLGLYIVFRSFGTESMIVFNQDLALLIGHLLVLTLREPGMYAGGIPPLLCRVAAVLMQFFFLAGYMFMLLESLQSMMIFGNLMPKGTLFSLTTNLAIGWGVPLAIVVVSVPIIGDEYTTDWTCWGDLERKLMFGLLVPMGIICSVAYIMIESAGTLAREIRPFKNQDATQRASAILSRSAMPFVLSLTLASHVMGMVAVFFQIVYLYGLCFIVNIVNAVAIFFFHTSMDGKIRTSVTRAFLKVVSCCRRK